MAIANETRIQYQHWTPAKPLSDFVGLFWWWRGHEVASSRERIMPMGTVELVINLNNGKPSRSGISGPRSRSLIIKRSAQDELLGVHFKPGGGFPFIPFPFGDLHNTGLTLSDLWGESRAAELLSRLHEAPAVEMKFRILEKWLLNIAAKPLERHRAVNFALSRFQDEPGLLSSATVAEKVGYSQRRFIELFRNEVGMTPKLFCRVHRFRRIIETIQAWNSVDWLDVAYSFGYSDQSHFIHEFREFSGLTPTDFFSLRTEYAGHVQVRD